MRNETQPVFGALLLALVACGTATESVPRHSTSESSEIVQPPRDDSGSAAMGTAGEVEIPPQGPIEPSPIWHPLKVGGVPIRVRYALHFAERGAGLSGVSSLPADHGMLFVYANKAQRQFWMKDCLLALDIAYLGDDGAIMVLKTLPAPRPGTTDAEMPRAPSGVAVRYVLEMEAGWFARHGFGPGTRVELPTQWPKSPDP